jgi:hypothetical protein
MAKLAKIAVHSLRTTGLQKASSSGIVRMLDKRKHSTLIIIHYNVL